VPVSFCAHEEQSRPILKLIQTRATAYDPPRAVVNRAAATGEKSFLSSICRRICSKERRTVSPGSSPGGGSNSSSTPVGTSGTATGRKTVSNSARAHGLRRVSCDVPRMPASPWGSTPLWEREGSSRPGSWSRSATTLLSGEGCLSWTAATTRSSQGRAGSSSPLSR